MPDFDRRTKRQRESDTPLARYLGELQAEVLEVFWEQKSATVREVLTALNKRRKQKLAYTTVLTLVSRLFSRGFLTREAEGRGFRYRALRDREGLLGDLSDQLIDRLLADFGDIAVARLGERVEDIDPETIKKLRALGSTS
jgi:predicted transcriptional regulator